MGAVELLCPASTRDPLRLMPLKTEVRDRQTLCQEL